MKGKLKDTEDREGVPDGTMENVQEKQFQDIIFENILELKTNTSLQKKTSKY